MVFQKVAQQNGGIYSTDAKWIIHFMDFNLMHAFTWIMSSGKMLTLISAVAYLAIYIAHSLVTNYFSQIVLVHIRKFSQFSPLL